jgi:hypothetical protein
LQRRFAANRLISPTASPIQSGTSTLRHHLHHRGRTSLWGVKEGESKRQKAKILPHA